jgi:hypothetical protein
VMHPARSSYPSYSVFSAYSVGSLFVSKFIPIPSPRHAPFPAFAAPGFFPGSALDPAEA